MLLYVCYSLLMLRIYILCHILSIKNCLYNQKDYVIMGFMASFRRGIDPKHARKLRTAGVRDRVVAKMRAGVILNKEEEAHLHQKGYEYVMGHERVGDSGVSGHIRTYRGMTPGRKEAQRRAAQSRVRQSRAWSR